MKTVFFFFSFIANTLLPMHTASLLTCLKESQILEKDILWIASMVERAREYKHLSVVLDTGRHQFTINCACQRVFFYQKSPKNSKPDEKYFLMLPFAQTLEFKKIIEDSRSTPES